MAALSDEVKWSWCRRQRWIKLHAKVLVVAEHHPAQVTIAAARKTRH